MNTSTQNVSCSGGLPVTLTVIFVVLKLVGVIAWSWLWVLSPLWIGFLLLVAFVAVVALITYLVN